MLHQRISLASGLLASTAWVSAGMRGGGGLMTNAGKVVTHRVLLICVGTSLWWATEYVRTIVNQLRRKLESDPENPKLILTELWIGYG